jgi:hypothetical protein
VSVEAPRAAVCGSCGTRFDLSPRNVRAWRQRGQEPVCGDCRHAPKEDPVLVERYKAWWLERYSLEELLKLGREIGWC